MEKQKVTFNIKPKLDFLKKLKEDFPQCFDKNGNFDFEKFKRELSKNEVDFSKESYGMDWLGKSYARILATDEATTLLKEDEEWNKKNKDSQNLLIKGDNLEVLKHLSNAYYEKIKMIYIDPPYNTGSDGFVYQDDRKFTVEELSKLAGIDKEKAKRILDFVNSKSNSHSAWLTFMYPRLYIARQLLRDDGVIFVSIDDNEVAQLRILMDEIFGEENFVATFTWTKKEKSSGVPPKTMVLPNKEYILCYQKEKDIAFKGQERSLKSYKRDKNNRWYRLMPIQATGKQNNFFTIVDPKTGIEYNGNWAFSKSTIDLMIKEGKINFPKNPKALPTQIVYADEFENKFSTIFEHLGLFESEISTKKLNNLFGKKVFDFPKPINLIKFLIEQVTYETKGNIILDFFAGSGTTGDAVMQLNAEDGGNRKYILVQLPEPIDEKKNKTTYDFVKNELGVENPTIFDITKERLIRAGKKIREETINKKIKEKQDETQKLRQQLQTDKTKEKINRLEKEIENLKNQDFGFKIFETIPLNEGVWEDYVFKAEEFDPQQKLFDETKLSDDDIKTLLTTWKTYDGIPLTEELKELDLDGYKGYYFETKLYLIDKGFKTKNLKKLLEEIDENQNFNPATIIAFGYNFESKILREIAENVKNYANKKQIDIDFIIRY